MFFFRKKEYKSVHGVCDFMGFTEGVWIVKLLPKSKCLYKKNGDTKFLPLKKITKL
jgi:hypothetical protein